MSVATAQLVLSNPSTASSDLTMYTVPPGRRTIVKEISLYRRGSGTSDYYIGVKAGGTTYYVASQVAAPAGTVLRLERWLVLKIADVLTFYQSVSSSWTVVVSGTELVLP